jgi:2-oxoglutarate dehydrogenase complex dehydrogenase (E1) component-like enzyme
VNADDVHACLAVAKLALAYRERYHEDFVVDLVGYRRWGHYEGDASRHAAEQARIVRTARDGAANAFMVHGSQPRTRPREP